MYPLMERLFKRMLAGGVVVEAGIWRRRMFRLAVPTATTHPDVCG